MLPDRPGGEAVPGLGGPHAVLGGAVPGRHLVTVPRVSLAGRVVRVVCLLLRGIPIALLPTAELPLQLEARARCDGGDTLSPWGQF